MILIANFDAQHDAPATAITITKTKQYDNSLPNTKKRTVCSCMLPARRPFRGRGPTPWGIVNIGNAMWVPRTIVGQARPLRAPAGHYGPGSCGSLGSCRHHWPLVGRALLHPPGPLWALLCPVSLCCPLCRCAVPCVAVLSPVWAVLLWLQYVWQPGPDLRSGCCVCVRWAGDRNYIPGQCGRCAFFVFLSPLLLRLF